ncbi:MAG: regulatory protein RecX [Spirochaetes bacterium]|nr:regulatory protein RecX [Spirochaetota bacterium]
MATIVKTRHADECITVEFDGGEIMKIPYGAAGPYRLEAGRSVDAEEYVQLKTESQRYRSKKMALDYLAICPRSAMEMERYLARKGFDHDLVREILEGLISAGYIDDADYAARYISHRCGKKVVGKNLLMNELLKKGIPRSIIRDALREAAPRLSSFEDVLALAEKKFAGMKEKNNGLSKLAYFLHGRGFDHDTVSRVIDRLKRGEED